MAVNGFVRSLLGLPHYAPLIPDMYDLALKRIKDLGQLRPLVSWIRIWLTPELTSYREGLQDILALSKAQTLPWLGYVKAWLWKLGLNSTHKLAVKPLYWEYLLTEMAKASRGDSFCSLNRYPLLSIT